MFEAHDLNSIKTNLEFFKIESHIKRKFKIHLYDRKDNCLKKIKVLEKK